MPQRAADLRPRDVRRPQIHDDQIEGRFSRLLQRRFAVADRIAAIAVEREVRADGFAQTGFMFDEQHAFRSCGSGNHGEQDCKREAIKSA